MNASLRIVRLIQVAMLATIPLYVVVGELAAHRKTPNLTLFYALSVLSVSNVGAILVVRRTLVAQSEEQLVKNPADAMVLDRWRTGYIVTYALCEALALVGLVLRLMGFGRTQVWPYYLGGFALLSMFVARPPRPESN